MGILSSAGSGAAAGSAAWPWGAVAGAAIGALASIFGSRSQSKATTNAANAQVSAANYAAQQQGLSNAATLVFLREQEATRQREHESTNAYNFNIWQTENTWAKQKAEEEAARQASQFGQTFGLSRDQLAQSRWATEQNLGLSREQMAQNADQFSQDISLRRDQQAYVKALEAARQGRLKPYQEFGLGTLAQLSQPIPGAAPAVGGSLATLAGR